MGWILSCETIQVPHSDRNGVTRLPPISQVFFSINIVFFYINHNENEIKELQYFSHHHCNLAAKVEKPLLKLRMGFWNSQHHLCLRHRLFKLSVTQCLMPETAMSQTSMHAAALGEKSYTLYWAPAEVLYFCNAAASPPLPHSCHLWFLCLLLTHPNLCIRRA